jgi:glycosyltransferase involved in cell wall biosynthesis
MPELTVSCEQVPGGTLLAPWEHMRIVHVTPGYWPQPGGGEVHVRRVSEGLASRGHDVTVLTVRSNEAADRFPPSPSELINSPRVRRFPENHVFRRLLRLRGAHRFLRAVLAQDRIRMIGRGPLSVRLFVELLRAKPDVVGVFGWWASVLPLEVGIAKSLRRWRMVGVPMFHTEETWSQGGLYQRLLRHCDAIVSNTGYEKQFVEKRVTERTRVLVGGVGIDPGLFAVRDGRKIRARLGMSRDPVVGYVGRIVPSKGVTALIKAMRVVWQWNPAVRLMLAGPRTLMGMEGDKEVELALGRLSESERVRVLVLGQFDEEDKANIFDSLDVFAMPSIGESFGIAYLEAWMCGKPVIGANVGSTPYVIRHGVDGLLVNPQDPRHIGETIVRLLKDPVERARLGQAGYARTMREFTWENVVDRIEDLYTELVSRQRVPAAQKARRASG